MESIIHSITAYITSLDWSYIMTFIFLSSLINHVKIRQSIVDKLGLKLRTRYRVVLVGLAMGIVLYFIRGYTVDKVEILLHSFVFAMVFHKLILDSIVKYVTGKPEEISEQTVTDKPNASDEEH